jgi:hypothetical protein
LIGIRSDPRSLRPQSPNSTIAATLPTSARTVLNASERAPAKGAPRRPRRRGAEMGNGNRRVCVVLSGRSDPPLLAARATAGLESAEARSAKAEAEAACPPEYLLSANCEGRKRATAGCVRLSWAQDRYDPLPNQPCYLCVHNPNTFCGYRGLPGLRGCGLAAIAGVQRVSGASSAKSRWYGRDTHRQLRIRYGPSELPE